MTVVSVAPPAARSHDALPPRAGYFLHALALATAGSRVLRCAAVRGGRSVLGERRAADVTFMCAQARGQRRRMP